MEAFAKVFELTRPEDIVHFFRDVHGLPARSARVATRSDGCPARRISRELATWRLGVGKPRESVPGSRGQQ